MISPTPETEDVPLHVLAETGQLPDHQYMDQRTLTWIAGNRPVGPRVPATMPHCPARLAPDDSWFASPAVIDSIDGARHNARASLLIQLLARHHGLGHDHALALAAAAARHDSRRLHDRDDPGHGKRAAHWLTSNLDTVAGAPDSRYDPHSRNLTLNTVSAFGGNGRARSAKPNSRPSKPSCPR
ncbi:hypothetical protein GCM10010430_01840 [Kitasatospora cystarginea]|uniref:HD Cas3-type domain-containing protein n=3 Tax=Kitasatospora TaxID=2063 RepID=A0ABN3DB64_9ACTN